MCQIAVGGSAALRGGGKGHSRRDGDSWVAGAHGPRSTELLGRTWGSGRGWATESWAGLSLCPVTAWHRGVRVSGHSRSLHATSARAFPPFPRQSWSLAVKDPLSCHRHGVGGCRAASRSRAHCGLGPRGSIGAWRAVSACCWDRLALEVPGGTSEQRHPSSGGGLLGSPLPAAIPGSSFTGSEGLWRRPGPSQGSQGLCMKHASEHLLQQPQEVGVGERALDLSSHNCQVTLRNPGQ